MGRSIGCEYEDSLEIYNIISQMKKLKPTELKNLFEVMINCLTIASKEGLVFLVWDGLEPHERDLFNFPTNEVYSETLKDSYLEIFERNQPLSSIWNNNDILRRNRIRTRNVYSGNDDELESNTRRRFDFNAIIDRIFNTGRGYDISSNHLSNLDSWSSLDSSFSESETSGFSSTSSSNNNSDNENENENDNDIEENNPFNFNVLNSNSSSERTRRHLRSHSHHNPPALTRRQLLRRNERVSSPIIPIPSAISNSNNFTFQRSRLPSVRRSNNSSNGVTSTRFVSTERRTMTVNNNDIRTFHVISRNRNRSQSSLNNNNNNDSSNSNNNTDSENTTRTAGISNNYNTNTNTNTGTNTSNNNNYNNTSHDTNTNSNSYSNSNSTRNTIHLSATPVDHLSTESNNNYIYLSSNSPRNIIRVSSGINLNLHNETNNSDSISNSEDTTNMTSAI